MKNLKVTTPDGEPTQEVLGEAIVEISRAAKRFLNGPLTRRAIVLLVQDNCKGIGPHGQQRIGKPTIDAVLDSIESLDTRYVKKKGKKGKGD